MNLLTVVCRGDLANLLYQAYSFKKNWLGTKKWFIVVEDYNKTTETLEWCCTNIKPILNDWDVQILNGCEIVCNNGYDRQQIYKLWAVAELIDSTHTLVLDAKNFLIRPINDTYFFNNQKVKVQIHNPGVTSPSWEECCIFFKEFNSTKRRPWNTTPWVWQKDLAQFTVNKYKEYGYDIYITSSLPVFEFEAYWFCNQNTVEWESCNFLDGVFADTCTEEYLLNQVESSINNKKPFWVYHRYHYKNSKLNNISNNYLKNLDIINDDIIKQWVDMSNYQNTKWPEIMSVNFSWEAS